MFESSPGRFVCTLVNAVRAPEFAEAGNTTVWEPCAGIEPSLHLHREGAGGTDSWAEQTDRETAGLRCVAAGEGNMWPSDRATLGLSWPESAGSLNCRKRRAARVVTKRVGPVARTLL